MFGRSNAPYSMNGARRGGHDLHRTWTCLDNLLWWINNEDAQNFSRLSVFYARKKVRFLIGEYIYNKSWVRFKESVIKNALELDEDERRNRGAVATTEMATS